MCEDLSQWYRSLFHAKHCESSSILNIFIECSQIRIVFLVNNSNRPPFQSITFSVYSISYKSLKLIADPTNIHATSTSTTNPTPTIPGTPHDVHLIRPPTNSPTPRHQRLSPASIQLRHSSDSSFDLTTN